MPIPPSTKAGPFLFALLVPAWSQAAVTEPNGVVVPGVSSDPGETSLQSYFDTAGETINASDDANAELGTFSPLCDFEAVLVLKQSQATAGIGWYNVPAAATGAPAAVYEIVPPNTPVGQVISNADILTSPDYLGGLIGFALMKNGAAVYYTEYQRNANCTMCTMPGYWKMALTYPSDVYANTFYLAFEDWEGANESTWHGNDGDFNDQVFRVTGVACPGGGEPCDTAMGGLCAPGITECVPGGEIICKAQVDPIPEVCDGLDNDCDGEIDQGDLCAAGEVCDRGECVAACGEVVFTCTAAEVCSDAGYCVDAACADVTCDAGQQCVQGECRAPCQGVVCPLGQVCLSGRCADPCADVVCEEGRVCDRGACVMACDCQPCGTGLECTESGACVDEGCGAQTCAAGTACVEGECVDACSAAACPLGERCLDGQCVDACNGVSCDTGQKCVRGVCADSCSDVTCNPGFKCVPGDDDQGECVDGCLGVDCGAGQACMNGSCGNSCTGVTCPSGEVCNAGACQDPCAGVACDASEVCLSGVCIGRCETLTCDAGQICQDGVCQADVVAPDPVTIPAGMGGQGSVAGPMGSDAVPQTPATPGPGAVVGASGASAIPPDSVGTPSAGPGVAATPGGVAPSPGVVTSGGTVDGAAGASMQPGTTNINRVVIDNPSGCGCRLAGRPNGSGSWVFWVATSVFVSSLARRRRSRATGAASTP